MVGVVAAFLFGVSSMVYAQEYKKSGSIHVGGAVVWDYLVADSEHERLYVSHNNEVDVIDLGSNAVIGKIDVKHVHGIAVADDFNRGYITDGGDDAIVVFDLKSNATVQKVTAGQNPDGLVFDPFSKRVFVFNGRSNDATVIDAASGMLAGTVALDGKPEFPATDGKGNVYVNIEDKSELLELDAQSLKIKQTWPLSPCEEPSGLAIDAEARRLFSVCANKKMVVVNADSGQVVAVLEIGEKPDAAGYDPARKLVFSSNGEGTLTIVKQTSPDKYAVLATVPTEKSARTMALDRKTHKIYLSAAEAGATPTPTASNPHPRPILATDSFHVVIVSAE
jgi:DNA-binding beta-propeller fold protein YncE